MSDRRVLVVGTTSDYIAHIDTQYPGRALFLTDVAERANNSDLKPNESCEILHELKRTEDSFAAIDNQLRRWNQELSGVTCYDCEWLGLAARIAEHYRLPFPRSEAVWTSRDKYRTKRRWTKHGVRCPESQLINSERRAVRFLQRLGRPIVLKPLLGSGSELTFHCRDAHETALAFRMIESGLRLRERSPLYRRETPGGRESASEAAILAEEFISGREYSCDFIIDDKEVQLIRVAKKLSRPALPFGTTTAYIVPGPLPGWLGQRILEERLRDAALAIGLERAVCMVDFVAGKDEIVFLELTPRIGGDCLPPLIRRCCGLDTIELALDFAEGRAPSIPPPSQWRRLVGLRLFADRSGIIRSIDTAKLPADPRVSEVMLKRSPGDRIVLPPEAYDTWLIGHVIFDPGSGDDIADQCEDLRGKLVLEVERCNDQKLARLHASSRRTAQTANATARRTGT